jgi:hypothetical protein
MDAIAKEFSLLFEKAAGILPIQVGRKIGQCIMDDSSFCSHKKKAPDFYSGAAIRPMLKSDH